jgi:aspartate kinase
VYRAGALGAFVVTTTVLDVSERLSVLKLGGSVLRDTASYAAAAHFLQTRLALHQDERLVVIVSAQHGTTDALLAEAQIIASDPSQDALDLLWSTGEVRSVALLALHLRRIGVAAAPFNVHQTGLVADRVNGTTVRPLRLQAALAHARVVIVPGFLGVSAGGTITSLGRGGSDLTAVLLAAAIGADACELIKDVPGYFTADPHRRSDARPIHDLTIDEALVMADAGCDLVQRAALTAAGAASLQLVIRSMDAAAPVTFVHASQQDQHGKDRSTHHGVRHQDDSRGPGVGA